MTDPEAIEHAADALPKDPIAAVTHHDPYPFYASLRGGPALVRHEGLKLWIASRADVVRAVLAHPALRVRPAAEPVPRAIVDTPAGAVFGKLVRMNDGASHARTRPILQAALARLDHRAASSAVLHVHSLWRSDASASGDLSDRLFDLPVAAVAHLIGFADDELARVAKAMRDFVACLSPLSNALQLARASDAAAMLTQRMREIAATPAPAAASLLAFVMQEASRDATEVVLANLIGLLSQTCDATAGLVGNSLLALARDPSLREALAADPSATHDLVREVARHDPSVQNTRRFVAERTTLFDTTLDAGDAVLLVLASANRDPALNPSPDRFELHRPHRRSLGFGHGQHACPGEALACGLAAATVDGLLREGLRLDTFAHRRPVYRPSVNARIPHLSQAIG